MSNDKKVGGVDIIALNEAEDAPSSRDERYRTLLKTAMDGFCLVDMQGCFLDVNATYCQMSGYSEQELLSMSIYDLESAEKTEDIAAHIQQIILTGEDRFTSQQRRKDGDLFDVEISVQYRPTDGGYFVCFLRDITDRKRADEALRESTERFISLADNIPGHVAYVDANTLNYQYVNGSFEKSFGLPKDTIIGSHIKELLGEKYYQHALPYIEQVRSGKSVSYQNTFTLVSGKRWIQVNYNPVFDTNRQVVSIAVLSYDITERKKAEEALQKNEILFRAFFESNPVATIITSPSGTIHMVNAAFAEGSGFSAEELKGKTAQELGFWRSPAERELLVNSIMDHGFIDNLEAVLYRKDGLPMTGLVCSRAFEQEDEVRILSTVVDVTAQREAEKALQKLDQAKSNFIATAAHELRTPLVAVLGYAELLENSGQLRISEQQRQSYSSIIRSNAEILTRLVDDLLDVERMQLDRPLSLSQKKTSLAKLIKEAIASLTPKCPDHRFILAHSDILPETMWVDGNRITQVMNNLLDNAVKYSPEGGVVEVTTETDERQIKISIKDQGIGMTSEEVEQVFNRFYRATPLSAKFRGLGLGMCIVKQIVKDHGGEVHVTSCPGEGTTITFTLPISEAIDTQIR